MFKKSKKSIIDMYIIKKRNTNITLNIVIKSQENKRGKGKKTYKNKSRKINKMAIRIYILITLYINGLNAPTEIGRAHV